MRAVLLSVGIGVLTAVVVAVLLVHTGWTLVR